MAVTNNSVFRSTDGGAVSGVNGRCSGTIGDGKALLNQLLLNGYNWQAVTNANLTNSGATGTLVLTAHGFNIDQRLWLVGMDQAGYKNGTTHGDALYPVTVPDGNTITFTTTGTPATATTGGGAGGTTTTLNGALTDTTGVTVVATDGVTHYPGSTSFVIQIDSEYMLVTAGMGTNSWTVVRGFARSTAATHSNAATITQVIMVGVAPAGGFTHWTADFTGTNTSTYRQPGGNRLYFDVDDNTSAKYMRVRGYEVMTAVATGTGPFPTVAQVAAGSYNVPKSNTADTTARPWFCIATDRMIYLNIDVQTQLGARQNDGEFLFTDLIGQSTPGDAYATLIVACADTGAGSNVCFAGVGATAVANFYMPRSYTQSGTSINVGRQPMDARCQLLGESPNAKLTFPHPPDGGLYLSQNGIPESSGIWRGIVPGVWSPMHAAKLTTDADSFLGTGNLAGKKFYITGTPAGNKQIVLEISNTIQAT